MPVTAPCLCHECPALNKFGPHGRLPASGPSRGWKASCAELHMLSAALCAAQTVRRVLLNPTDCSLSAALIWLLCARTGGLCISLQLLHNAAASANDYQQVTSAPGPGKPARCCSPSTTLSILSAAQHNATQAEKMRHRLNALLRISVAWCPPPHTHSPTDAKLLDAPVWQWAHPPNN